MTEKNVNIPIRTLVALIGAAGIVSGGATKAMSPPDSTADIAQIRAKAESVERRIEDVATLKAQAAASEKRVDGVCTQLERMERKLDRVIERLPAAPK